MALAQEDECLQSGDLGQPMKETPPPRVGRQFFEPGGSGGDKSCLT
jgi:hypothetical protein